MFDFLREKAASLTQALKKTRRFFSQRLQALFGRSWDAESYLALEQLLYEADLGAQTVDRLLAAVQEEHRGAVDIDGLVATLEKQTLDIAQAIPLAPDLLQVTARPYVIFFIGINGVGKTTSLVKLAYWLKKAGKSVLIGAADTFRAAASEQLSTWCERLDIPLVRSTSDSDPSAVAFDTLQASLARQVDYVLIDTAGRLHNKSDLMRELKKMKRTASKVIPGSPHQTWMVLDATHGQNSAQQVHTFQEEIGLSGLFLTKVDGSAKGGSLLSICLEAHLPCCWVGTGENVEDLEPFLVEKYVKSLFEIES